MSNNHGNPLPSAAELATMLRSQSLAEVTATLGADRKAITTKLRRYGMAVGHPTGNYVLKNKRPTIIAAPMKKEKAFHPDRVERTTMSGAVVTLLRIPTIDGYADCPHHLQAAE